MPKQAATPEPPEMLSVGWRDHALTVPASVEDWELDTLEAFEDGKAITFARGLLGSEQYATVKADGLTVRDFGELMDVIAQALGFTSAGESPASSD